MIHDLSSGAKHVIDGAAFLLAGVAVISLLQAVALVVTIAAGLGSLSLVALRWHQYLKSGELSE